MAGKLGETSVHLPFWDGSVAVLAGVAVLLAGRSYLHGVEHEVDPVGSIEKAEAVTVGS